GAAFALAVRRFPRSTVLMTAVVFAAAWYYISFRVLWKSVIPLAFLLHPETATIIGHLIYGTFLGRFPVYLEEPRKPEAPSPEVPSETTNSASTLEPVSTLPL